MILTLMVDFYCNNFKALKLPREGTCVKHPENILEVDNILRKIDNFIYYF